MSNIVMRHGSWLAMDPKGLFAWSNRGTVKRARNELSRGRIAWDIDEQDHATIVSWSDNVETTLPVDAFTSNVFEDASCDCLAIGMCRHVISAMLVLMQVHRYAAENLQQDGLDFGEEHTDDPLETEPEAIVTRGAVPKVVFFSPPQVVHFWSRRAYQLGTCDCGAQGSCKHKELARRLVIANDHAHEVYTSKTPDNERGRISHPPERLVGMGFRVLERAEDGSKNRIVAAMMTALSHRPCFIEQPLEDGVPVSKVVHRSSFRGRDLASLAHGQIVARTLTRSRRGILNLATRSSIASYPQNHDWEDFVTNGAEGSFEAIARHTERYTEAFPPDLHTELSFHVSAIESVHIDPDGSLLFEDPAGNLARYRHPSLDEQQTLPFLQGLIEEGGKPRFMAGIFDPREEGLSVLPFSIVLEREDGSREMFIPSLPPDSDLG